MWGTRLARLHRMYADCYSARGGLGKKRGISEQMTLPCAAKARMLAIPGRVGLSEEDMGIGWVAGLW